MLGDTPKPQRKPKTQAGRLTLVLGDDAGTTIVGETQAGDTQPLAQALAKARRELDAPPAHAATIAYDAERASDAMRKVQEVLDHFTEIAEGHIDAETLGNWADELIGQLKGMDPDEYWQERLRVLRTLVVLLALVKRWLELAQSLSDALQAAERLGDDGARAWVMHELGTLHLAAEQHAEADSHLSQALQLRARAKDEAGVKATEANLRVLCKMLRSQLHQASPADEQPSLGPTNGEPASSVVKWLLRRPLLLLVLGLAFLAVGGVAGAAISGEPSVNVHRLAVVIESVPATPRIDEPVIFRAVVKNRADPDHYSWLFDDGEGTNSASPTHVYLRPGSYTVMVAVSGPHGTAGGEAARTVIVRPRSSPLEPSPPAASFSFAPSPALAGHTVRFNASGSSDPDPRATISDYLWKFGDGQTQAGVDPTHVYAKAGTYTVELIVADTRGASSRTTHTIVVYKQTNKPSGKSVKPAFTSATSATFAAGTSERFPVTATGKPTPTITESGTLPGGVSFVGSAMSGIPTTTGTFPLTFTATNSAGAATQSFTLTVEPQRVTIDTGTTATQPPAESKPTFTSAESTTFKYGREEHFPVTANSEPTPTIASEGKLPEGVKFDEGVLIGTARQIGTFTLKFTASNKAGSTIQTFVLKIIE